LYAMFIADWLRMMFEGNMVAWGLFASGAVNLALVTIFVILLWKMPDPAKRLTLNNFFRGHPIIADSYDDQSVKFETPPISREGFFHDKRSGFHFLPRLSSDAEKTLTMSERELITKAFRVGGTNSAFYLGYSGKGTVVNPAIQKLIEHSEMYEKLRKSNPGIIQVPKKALIDTMQKMKDKFVQIEPVWITQFLDPRKIKEYMPKAFTKSQLASQEQKVREDVRGEVNRGGSMGILAILLVGVLVLQVVCLAKQFGMF